MRLVVAGGMLVGLMALMLAGCGGSEEASGPTDADEGTEQVRTRLSYLDLSGKPALEATLLPLKNFQDYFPVIPTPPDTAGDFDERIVLRDIATRMVEEKNVLFLNAMHEAIELIDKSGDWQAAYESFLVTANKEGGAIRQLEEARASGEICPGTACDPESGLGLEGCPHTHGGNAKWAPDGSLLGVVTYKQAEGFEVEPDTIIIDYDCRHGG